MLCLNDISMIMSLVPKTSLCLTLASPEHNICSSKWYMTTAGRTGENGEKPYGSWEWSTFQHVWKHAITFQEALHLVNEVNRWQYIIDIFFHAALQRLFDIPDGLFFQFFRTIHLLSVLDLNHSWIRNIGWFSYFRMGPKLGACWIRNFNDST